MIRDRLANNCSQGHTTRSWFGTARSVLLSTCMLVLLASCASTRTAREAQRVLFVGNSVIYTNNLPAVFERIVDAQSDAPEYRVDMFARGGATLTELAQDSRVLDLLASGRYDIVVLQERGGDDLCVLAPADRETASCQALIDSHVRLARLAREHGARVLYLGTYQLAPGASQALVRAERRLGTQMAAQYVEISERLRTLRESQPQLPWLYVDKGHPGIATTALMGVRLYETLNGNSPLPFELCTGVELYTPKWKHDGVAPHAEMIAEIQPTRCLLSRGQMDTITRGTATTQSTSDAQPAL